MSVQIEDRRRRQVRQELRRYNRIVSPSRKRFLARASGKTDCRTHWLGRLQSSATSRPASHIPSSFLGSPDDVIDPIPKISPHGHSFQSEIAFSDVPWGNARI